MFHPQKTPKSIWAPNSPYNLHMLYLKQAIHCLYFTQLDGYIKEIKQMEM